MPWSGRFRFMYVTSAILLCCQCVCNRSSLCVRDPLYGTYLLMANDVSMFWHNENCSESGWIWCLLPSWRLNTMYYCATKTAGKTKTLSSLVIDVFTNSFWVGILGITVWSFWNLCHADLPVRTHGLLLLLRYVETPHPSSGVILWAGQVYTYDPQISTHYSLLTPYKLFTTLLIQGTWQFHRWTWMETSLANSDRVPILWLPVVDCSKEK